MSMCRLATFFPPPYPFNCPPVVVAAAGAAVVWGA